MRVRCHGCHSGWEFPGDTSIAHCPSCRILALAPPARTLTESALTVEPSDHEVLGLTGDVRGAALAAAWASFLEKVPFDRYPAAFRQGRLAFDRLNAASESPPVLQRWPIAGRCLVCDESARFGFRSCVLCRGSLKTGVPEQAAAPVHEAGSDAPSLADAEALWAAGDLDALLATVERGLAGRESGEVSRARLDLLAGHALASQGNHGEAIERWTRASAIGAAAPEARFCLAALAYRRNLAEEAIVHANASGASASETMALLAGSALAGIGRADEAIARLSPLFDSRDARLAARARWAAASTEYAGGNPSGVLAHLRAAIAALTGRRDEPELVQSLAPVDIAKLHSHLIWLTGVTWSALGNDDLAESWLALGQQLAPADPAFPRERGTIALRSRRVDEARASFDEAERRGDAKGAARGRVVADWIAGGHAGAAPLLAAAESGRDPILFYHAGRQLEREGNTTEAARAYTRATVLDPLMGRAFASLGVLHGRAGDGEAAIRALRRARAAGERGTVVLRALATLLVERGGVVEAIPLLEEILRRSPDDRAARNNLAGAQRLLALRYANDEKEEEALECLTQSAAADPEGSAAWERVAAEIAFRAACRLAHARPAGWESSAEELLDRAARHDPGDLRIRLRLGVVRLAGAFAGGGDPALHGAIATLQAVSAAPAASPAQRFSAELHRAIGLYASGATPQGDEIASRLAKNPSIDPLSRLRARWVLSLSLARNGMLLQARVLLEESARECDELPGAAALLRFVRLQILKLRAAEQGAHKLERDVQSLEPGTRGAPAQLYWGIALAALGRIDDADRCFEAAAHEPSLRRDASASRAMMHLARIARLLRDGNAAAAHRLLGTLRPSLPQDPAIDRWLGSLEVEGVPVAALRQGDAAKALDVWSARAQRWKLRDAEHWELVRSIALASHAAALAAERADDRAAALTFWSTAIDRWLELLDADEYWQSFARRARELFPGLDASTVGQVRDDVVETHLAGRIRGAIEELRTAGRDAETLDRYALLARIESWRLAKHPADESVRKRLAAANAQRRIIATRLERWDEALEAGAAACAADPGDPAHFVAAAATCAAKANVLLDELHAKERENPGTALFELTGRIVDQLSLGLAWNPHDRAMSSLFKQLSIQLGYAGLPESDRRIERAEALRKKLPPDALEHYCALLAGDEGDADALRFVGDADIAEAFVSGPEGEIELPEHDVESAREMVRKWKDEGLNREAIYWSLVSVYPSLATARKTAVLELVDTP